MFIDLLRSRRSSRKYQDKPVETEKINILMEAVLRSFSSHNRQPWEFVMVTDPGMLIQLSKARPSGSSFLKNSKLAFVVSADTSKSDVWVEDASIAAAILHLAATDVGLGSCWVQIRNREFDSQTLASEYVAELLNLREELEVESIIAMGYPAESKAQKKFEELDFDKISCEKFGQKS